MTYTWCFGWFVYSELFLVLWGGLFIFFGLGSCVAGRLLRVPPVGHHTHPSHLLGWGVATLHLILLRTR